jgi:hypothetical protein
VAVPPRSRSELRRPDTVEVGEEFSDPLCRRRDHPLVAVPDLHPMLTSPLVLCAQRRDATVRFLPIEEEILPSCRFE